MSQITELRDGLAELHRELGFDVDFTDKTTSELAVQIVMLEEILFARWPRSWLLRRRWRRSVRGSVREMPGDTFVWRRLNGLATDWLAHEYPSVLGARTGEPGPPLARPTDTGRKR